MSTAVNFHVDTTVTLLMWRRLLSSSSDNADYDIPQCLGLNLEGLDSWNWSELLRLWQALITS